MSKIEVNQISSQCGSTLTVGQSGDTVTLAAGATQSGFGRTGTVDWDTTAKTASFTAVSGNGYFVNTTSGAVTMTLPATPSAGDIVAFKDYTGTFATNNLTIARNGSNLDGSAVDKVINTDNTSMSLIYVDATQGWKSVEEGTGFIGETFITATGGTITTCGDCKIHTFTSPGSFCVSNVSCIAANNQVSYLVIAGGGGGGSNHGGGGGAGGFREDKSPVTPYTASPLEGAGPITVTATAFPITVGGGGAAVSGNTGAGNCGSNSVFSTITSTGGGGGGGEPSPNGDAKNGGSGGGQYDANAKGNGNTPPVSPPQGNPGGNSGHSAPNYGEGGGGGATAAGGNGTSTVGGNGGAGATTSINGTPTAYAGGGGASTYEGGTAGTGGAGGGGNGTKGGPTGTNGTAGTTNTGGGGGGGERFTPCGNGFAGGSGIVIIRYKFQ